jgi:hypothetical protein
MIPGWPKVALSDWLVNAGARLVWVETAGERMAITRSLPPRAANMTYLTSLRSHWFDYLAHEMGPDNRLKWVVSVAGQLAHLCGLDRLSLIGNEPVSTVLRSEALKARLVDVAEQESRLFPEHWIGIRNLLYSRDHDVIASLLDKGYRLIPTRVVYLFDARHRSLPLPSHLKRDRKLLEKSGLISTITQNVSDAECTAITTLYRDVYLAKHSPLNADYRPLFFSDVIGSGLMECLLLKDADHVIRAFALLQRLGEDLVVPAVGHDTSHPDAGYYRQLFAALSLYTEKHHLRLNYSSGAGDFKRKRGGVPELELTAIKAPRHAILSPLLIRCMSLSMQKVTAEMMMINGA